MNAHAYGWLALVLCTALQAGRPMAPKEMIALPGACPGITTMGELSHPGGTTELRVIFIGRKPSQAAAARTARQYLAQAIHRDGRHDIQVTAWSRKLPRDRPRTDRPLRLSRNGKALCYCARTHRIGPGASAGGDWRGGPE